MAFAAFEAWGTIIQYETTSRHGMHVVRPPRSIPMDEILTMAEIEERFGSEWVLLEDPETTESLEIKKGTVRWHCQDRDELYRKAHELRPRHSAVIYTGSMPEDMAVVL